MKMYCAFKCQHLKTASNKITIYCFQYATCFGSNMTSADYVYMMYKKVTQ